MGILSYSQYVGLSKTKSQQCIPIQFSSLAYIVKVVVEKDAGYSQYLTNCQMQRSTCNLFMNRIVYFYAFIGKCTLQFPSSFTLILLLQVKSLNKHIILFSIFAYQSISSLENLTSLLPFFSSSFSSVIIWQKLNFSMKDKIVCQYIQTKKRR